jgi:hypothetical protein
VSALTKYDESLVNAPGRGGGLHQHVMSIACLGVLAELPQDVIMRDLYGLDGIKRNEPEDAVKKAFQTVDRNYETPKQRPISRFAPKLKNPLGDFIAGISDEMVDLIDRSPIGLVGDPEQDGRLTIETLYSGDEFLFIGDVFDAKVKTVKEWLKEDLSKYPHIIPNPMTGKEGMTGMAKISYRCEETVEDLRYAVCEMDEIPIRQQVAFWNKCIDINIPVAAVIHSGSKSLHGWIKVDCGTDTDKWEKDVRGWLFNEFGKNYGLDPACSNRARLSRLAGYDRPKKTRQRLLYLNGAV